jgi:hypothetical protein
MGRRSRRRAERPSVARPTPGQRPRAPWHPFPLVELAVLAGIVLLVLGVINADSDRGRAMLVAGMLLGSLGGLDTVLREHFSGYRSHALVLAGLPTVAIAAILYFTRAPWPIVIVAALATFAAALTALTRAYRGW